MIDTNHIESIQIEHKPGSVDQKAEAPGKFPFSAFEFDESGNKDNPRLDVIDPWYLGVKNGLHVQQASNAYTRMPVTFYRNSVVGATGAIKITIPESRSMIEFMIATHTYGSDYASNKTGLYLISGYMYTPTPIWNSPGACMICNAHNGVNRVRWCRDDTGKWCILIGDTTTTWPYLFTEVIWAHADYSSVDCMKSDWSMTLVTSTSGYTIDRTIDATMTSRSFASVREVGNASYTIPPNDAEVFNCDPSSADRTITLPALASSYGRLVTVKRATTSSYKLTVTGNGSETIEGLLTYGLGYNAGNYVTLVATTSDWKIIASSLRKENILAVSADYTVLDDDGVSVLEVTTGSSNRTMTLPTAADNIGRVLTVIKADTGTGNVIVDGEGSETVGAGAATSFTLYVQGDYVTIICDGSQWIVIATSGPEVLYTSASDVAQASPAAGTWYNPSGHSVSVTPGIWDVTAVLAIEGSLLFTVAGTSMTLGACVSTASNSESSAVMGGRHVRVANSTTTYTAQLTFSLRHRVLVTVAGSLYLNMMVSHSGGTTTTRTLTTRSARTNAMSLGASDHADPGQYNAKLSARRIA